MNNKLDLLDCVTHGTSTETFLESFNGDVDAAAAHLAEFYMAQLVEEHAHAPSDDDMRAALRNAKRQLAQL